MTKPTATNAATKPVAATEPVAKPLVVTQNELVLLKAIAKTAKDLKVNPVEVAVPYNNPFENKYIGAGTMASAMRKGLVESQDYGTKQHAVSLTQVGFEQSRKRLPHEDKE